MDSERSSAPARLVASHLRDFAEFLPVEKREDFNATIDDLVDRLATAHEANTALYRALRSDTAPLSPKSENSRDNAPMVPQTIREKSNTTSAGCVSVPSEAYIDRALAARIHGGSQAADWFADTPPYHSERSKKNIRDVVRAMLAAAPVAADTKCAKRREESWPCSTCGAVEPSQCER